MSPGLLSQRPPGGRGSQPGQLLRVLPLLSPRRGAFTHEDSYLVSCGVRSVALRH